MRDLRTDLASLRIERLPSAPRRKRRLLFGLALLLALGGAGFAAWSFRGSLAAVPVQTAKPTLLRAGEAPRPSAILTASGYVVARRKAVVSAKVQGRLGELRVEEGSSVKEGEIIAKLESLDYAAQVERARAAVQRSEAELEESRRQARLSESLNEGGVVSGDELEAVRSRLRITEADLRQARADLGVYEAFLENTNIRAPFDGVVIKKMAEVGESVAPIPPGVNVSTSSGAIVALADMSSLEMEADVNEAHIAKIANGQKAEVTVEAFPDRRYPAVLRQVIPSADRTKATVLVKVTLLEKDEHLKPEMSARVTFFHEPKEDPGERGSAEFSIRIPADAVVSGRGPPRVFEVVDGRALAREVVLGGRYGTEIVVSGGLTGSETLVLRPPAELGDGDAVEVTAPPQGASKGVK